MLEEGGGHLSQTLRRVSFVPSAHLFLNSPRPKRLPHNSSGSTFLLSAQCSPNSRGSCTKIMKPALFLIYLLVRSFILCNSRPITRQQPDALRSFKINATQNQGSCTYMVSIRTSCFSPRYTRDQISLVFGDAYGNQVYEPRLYDPSDPRTFERCSTDTFQINGPCTHQVCYVYVYRKGYDGWRPKTVTVQGYGYGYSTQPVTFYYGASVPLGVWFGFNHCTGGYVAA